MKRTISILLSAALLLVLAACGAGNTENTEDTAELKLVDSTAVQEGTPWSPATGVWFPIFSCDTQEETYYFEIHACNGRFYVQNPLSTVEADYDYYATDFIQKTSGELLWDYGNTSEQIEVSGHWAGTRTFIEILITDKVDYIGYAVVALERGENSYYIPTLLACKVLASDAERDGVKKATFQALIEEAEEAYLKEA